MDTTAKWHEATKTGNATQSKKVNNLIKAVVRAETRGTGQETVADRAFTLSELKQILCLMPERRYRAMMCFQYHLIGRGDDTAHVRKSVLKASTEFHGYLTAKIRWSKNVADESACPEQILIPSMDTRTCVYFSLALWLEHWIQYGEGTLSQWMFVDGVATRQSTFDEQDKEARLGNSKYRAAIKRIVECDTFKSTNTVPGILGSHSIRKLATSEIRRRGVPKDDIDYRARWKSATRMQDRYTDIQLNWPDVNAASNLCLGGACTYKVKQDAGITDDWVANNCAVGITSVFGAEAKKIYENHNKVEDLKALIVETTQDAFLCKKRHKYIGYLGVTARDLIYHLLHCYGNSTTAAEMEMCKQSMNKAIDAALPIDVLFKTIDDAIQYAADGLVSFTDNQVLKTVYHAVSTTGMYTNACKEWRRKDPSAKTWLAFKTFFAAEYHDRKENFPAQIFTLPTLLYLALAATTNCGVVADLTTPNQQLTATNQDLTHQLNTALQTNAALFKQSSATQPIVSTKPATTASKRPIFDQAAWEARLDPLGYCLTHGYKHNSSTCNTKNHGHEDMVTRKKALRRSTRGKK